MNEFKILCDNCWHCYWVGDGYTANQWRECELTGDTITKQVTECCEFLSETLAEDNTKDKEEEG